MTSGAAKTVAAIPILGIQTQKGQLIRGCPTQAAAGKATIGKNVNKIQPSPALARQPTIDFPDLVAGDPAEPKHAYDRGDIETIKPAHAQAAAIERFEELLKSGMRPQVLPYGPKVDPNIPVIP